MKSLLLALPALGCVLMMPAMMWLMSRGMHRNDASTPPDQASGRAPEDELTQLRQEVARLRSQVDAETRSHDPAGS